MGVNLFEGRYSSVEGAGRDEVGERTCCELRGTAAAHRSATTVLT